MKNYIGIKIVKAMPGTMAEAEAIKTGIPYEEQIEKFRRTGTKDQQGYIVKYPDGHIGWSPREVFEADYRELECEDFIRTAG